MSTELVQVLIVRINDSLWLRLKIILQLGHDDVVLMPIFGLLNVNVFVDFVEIEALIDAATLQHLRSTHVKFTKFVEVLLPLWKYLTFSALKLSLTLGRVLACSSFFRNLLIPERFLSTCLLYTSPSPRDGLLSRMPSSA
eukprot:TRINITY_DN1394_c0_g3_i3.p2 TRINITY_DN1394_c0_g3~~TRINITY_DN1394_c0_g3_i3.p2  ORF type:complete len:140 (-),score=30.86 TRINITY_DN1394_c0_g3_i3:32-451(-)